jgi:nitrate reductase (NAD(P)H)
MMALLQATSITVRAFNSSKQTQPEKPVWNIMGMMNNCWYVARPELVKDENAGCFATLFRHPTEPGTGSEGWMRPSIEDEMERVKREASTPHKEFTRREIEKHNHDDDCWIVVDGKVYDATSVLRWHPGGKAAIMNHAGRVHQETSDEFASIHDDFAYNKLNGKYKIPMLP